jgi:hypothetical protein
MISDLPVYEPLWMDLQEIAISAEAGGQWDHEYLESLDSSLRLDDERRILVT